MWDVKSIRKDFPILESKVYGKPLIYFDNAATTQRPLCVVEKLTEGLLHHNANVHRGVHFLSQEATELHEGARERIRQFIGAKETAEIIFTRGTTESLNLVANCFGDQFLQAGDEVIVTDMEHHSNIVSWQLVARRRGFILKHAPLNERQELDLEAWKALFNEHTKLVSVTHISNVLGTVNPIAEMTAFAHSKGVPVVVDGAQSVAHERVDVQALDCDFFAFSGHKVYGPTGIGVLYGKRQWLDALPPYQGGGDMIKEVSFEGTTFNELPYKFEAGTPDFEGTVALATALDYVDRLGRDEIAQYEHSLLTYCTDLLSQVPDIRIFGNAREKAGVMSFLVGNIHPYDMGMMLDKMGIAVRTGHHCAQPLMDSLGIPGTVRASFSFYNTPEEIEALVNGVKRVAQMFAR